MREAAPRRAQEASHAAASTAVLDPTSWQKILQVVRTQHPSLNRSWFDQLTPRQLTNGVIQVNVNTPAQLNFCQSQCQQPFTAAAQAATGRLVERGWLTPDGAFTAAGRAGRAAIEAHTDVLAGEPVERLGADGLERLVALMAPAVALVRERGGVPASWPPPHLLR